MTMQPSVILIDDEPAVRDSLTLLLETLGFEVESYDSAEAFLQGHCPGKPGCVVLDVNMPGMSGPELQAELIRRDIRLPIIFLTAHGDIPMTVRAIQAGAIDFLTKPVKGKQLVERVTMALQQQAAMSGQSAPGEQQLPDPEPLANKHQTALSEQTAPEEQQSDGQEAWAAQQQAMMLDQSGQKRALCERISGLTPREKDVMSLAVAGHANKEIARHLGISHRTVEIHRARVMEKTGATNLLALARICEACKGTLPNNN